MYRNDLLIAKKAVMKKTLQDIADETGLGLNTVGWILNNPEKNHPLKNIDKVARALGLTMPDLFTDKPIEAAV